MILIQIFSENKLQEIDKSYITAKIINYLGGSNTVSIESSQNLLSGNYQLQVTGPQNKLAAIKVIVQK